MRRQGQEAKAATLSPEAAGYLQLILDNRHQAKQTFAKIALGYTAAPRESVASFWRSRLCPLVGHRYRLERAGQRRFLWMCEKCGRYTFTTSLETGRNKAHRRPGRYRRGWPRPATYRTVIGEGSVTLPLRAGRLPRL